MSYLRTVLSRNTPQSQSLLGSTQVRNNAGGYAFPVDDWTRLERFLILGSEGGSYYVGERQLTRQNAEAVVRCISADGVRVVETIRAVSESGRAPKQEPALFALALACSLGDVQTRAIACDAVPVVCRTGTHLLHFASYVNALRGWGRGLRRATASWFSGRSDLAYQAVKYQERDGWALRDLLRLSHAKPTGEAQGIVYHWIAKGWPGVGVDPHPVEQAQIVWAFERAKRATDAAEIVRLIRDYRLPREAIPTQFLTDAAVWEALLIDLPMTAMVRNLATMTRVGLVTKDSEAARKIVAELGNIERLRQARVHPIALLSALQVYAQGHGERSDTSWSPVSAIVDALDAAFYAAFANVTPTGKRIVVGIDVSGSMAGMPVVGLPGMQATMAAAALALVTMATEPQARLIAFDTHPKDLTISPNERLDSVLRKVQALISGGTDCAVPIRWATEHGRATDAFIVLTDSETWAGSEHPVTVLRDHRQRFDIASKLVVQALAANHVSIGDTSDGGTLDIAGLDSASPGIVRDFIA